VARQLYAQAFSLYSRLRETARERGDESAEDEIVGNLARIGKVVESLDEELKRHGDPSLPQAKSACPYPVVVYAPQSAQDGDVVAIAAEASHSGAEKLKYTWTLSPPAARILAGQETPEIKIDTTGLGGQKVTAVVVVDDGSGDRACRQAAQVSTSVKIPYRSAKP
jgi:hypothetical protein